VEWKVKRRLEKRLHVYQMPSALLEAVSEVRSSGAYAEKHGGEGTVPPRPTGNAAMQDYIVQLETLTMRIVLPVRH
jgi:hypothetical protein